MGEKLLTKDARNRYPALARAALRIDEPRDAIPGLLDPQDPGLEVDAAPAKRLKLAAARAGVDGCCPEDPVVRREHPKECIYLARLGDSVAGGAILGKRESLGRVDGDLLAIDGAAIDRP